jgi:hypothetical protein
MPFKMPKTVDGPIEESGLIRGCTGILINYARRENCTVGEAYDKLLKYCQDKHAKEDQEKY